MCTETVNKDCAFTLHTKEYMTAVWGRAAVIYYVITHRCLWEYSFENLHKYAHILKSLLAQRIFLIIWNVDKNNKQRM